MISEKAMQRMKSKVQQRVGATPPATWAKVGVGVLVGGVAIGWIAFPYVLDKVVASQINLAQGRDSRRLWVQLPTLGCNMYVFNVTNPSEVMRGAKMVVEEIGPYCYKEVKDKTDFVEDPTSDTISYSARTTWYENQRSPSCPAPHLTGDELIVVPNVPILSILLIAEKDFPAPFLTLVSQALPAIFGRVNDLFMRVTARTLLFDGLLINCTATALYPRAVCIALKQNSRALKKISENVYSFSFFGAKNHTPEEFRYTVKRGTVDGQDIGRLVALDGKPELPFWRGDCNKIQGTDASVFPPFRKMENGSLVAYSSEACRIIFGIFEGEDNYKGVTGYVYSAYPFGDADTNPGDRCYCPSDDRCRKRGALDSLKCQGAPLVASHPHFYQASPQYIDGVEGLNPDKEKHGIKIMLEPISGTPLIVRKRIQFNIDLRPIRFVPLTQGLRRTLVPLFWAEELLDLEGDLMGMLEASLFRPIRAVDVIKWMCVVGGVGLGVLGVVLKIRKHRRDKVHAINGEVGQEFDYESDPKSVIKPSVINGGNEVFDPFYINPVKNEEKSGKIMNGQQLVISKKSASTMTTPNVSRPASFVKLDVKQLSLSKGIQNGNTFLRNHPHVNDSASFFVAKERNEIPEIHTNVGKHTKEDEKLQIQTNVSSSPTEFQNTSSVNLHSPKIFSSLEHQISFKSPSRSINNLNLAQSETEKLPMSNQKKLRTSHSLENVRNNGDVEPDQAIESVLVSNKNPTILDNVFGDSIEEKQPEYVIPHQNIGESDSLPNKDNNETSDRDSDPDSSKGETEPSAEVIKAVEEDINKLIAEMAKLMPKNKTVEINDD